MSRALEALYDASYPPGSSPEGLAVRRWAKIQNPFSHAPLLSPRVLTGP